MKKISLLVALVILMMAFVQCTEDEDMEASVNQSEFFISDSGEEGSDSTDNDKDE